MPDHIQLRSTLRQRGKTHARQTKEVMARKEEEEEEITGNEYTPMIVVYCSTAA